MHFSKKDYIEKSIVILSFISVVMIIFKGAEWVYHSDTATALLFANEQITMKQIFPEGWIYADSIWTNALNWFILPFMLFIEDWVLCRNLGVIVQLLFTLFFLYVVSKKLSHNNAWLALVLYLLPLSPTTIEHFFFQGTYGTQVLWYFVVIASGFLFADGNISKKIRILSIIFGGMTTILLGMGGHRHVLTLSAPLLASYFIVCYQEWLKERKISEKIKENIKWIAIIACSVGFGMIAYMILNKTVIVANLANNAVISQGYELIYRFGAAIGNIFTVYGAVDFGTLISVGGVFKFIKTVLCVVLIVYIPFVLFKKYNLMSLEQKIFYIYSMLAFGLTLYVNIFTNIGHARYYLITYVNSAILMCIWIEIMNLDRVIKSGIILMLMIVGLYSHRHYYIYDYTLNLESVGYYPSLKNPEELLECLKKNDLTLGYATYWNSYVVTALTDGDIQVLSLEGDSSSYIEMKPYYWLTNQNWYEKDYHTGRSFLLLTEEELEKIDKSFILNAEEHIDCGIYNIFIYSYDILDEKGE